ncbi:hypothetical protein HPB49_013611 [Dermacentor silvarum]|uniref:Uncharacterized protein n=1 Tax=Dermacentor silvarum TaxID=543639 RepID=A0ACB8C412_DERSI|nr:hypothetical protein HPB49_013611 [Dermacentor silvarum]
MATCEYILTGFDDFLERWRLAFIEPMPATRACCICSLMPPRSVLLPCGHVLCQLCKGEIGNEAMCPQCHFDGSAYPDAGVVTLNFSQCDMEQRRILLLARAQNRTLSELRGHLDECGRNKETFAKCQRFVVRNVVVNHYRQCSDGTFQYQGLNGTGPRTAVRKLGAIKKDQSAYVNVANCLMERVAEVKRVLIQVRKAPVFMNDARRFRLRSGQSSPDHSQPRLSLACSLRRVFKDVHTIHNSVKKTEKKERKI